MSAPTHRITVQFDARLSFNLNLPADDAALVRDQTPIRVVVERVRGGHNRSSDGSVAGNHGDLDGLSDSLNGSFSGSVNGGLNGSITAGNVAGVASPCASYALLLRVGEGAEARDYPQAEFVHRSAAEGAGQCLLQYLAGKEKLNVVAAIETEAHRPHTSDHQTYTAVGWSMSKADAHHPDGDPTICGPRHSLRTADALEDAAESVA